MCSAHVHLNEPGRTDWEGFWTGTRAAASGGVTTLVDMPLNSIPPTTTVANLEEKRTAARGQCWTDVAFWGGVIPKNQVARAVAPRFDEANQRFWLLGSPQAARRRGRERLQVLPHRKRRRRKYISA